METRVMYLGYSLNTGKEVHRYIVINDDNTLGKSMVFSKKLFTKGSVGAIYKLTEDGNNVVYTKSNYPNYYIVTEGGVHTHTTLFFKDTIEKYQAITEASETIKKMASKDLSHLDEILNTLNDNYRDVHWNLKPGFLAYCITKITK